MNDKIAFREMLVEIGALAESKGNKLTIEEINDFFKTLSLDDEKMELVYGYLEANKIIIEGHKKTKTAKLFETNEKPAQTENEAKEESNASNIVQKDVKQEDKYLEIYLRELGTLQSITDHEKKELYNKVIKNDALAKSKLIELYLPKVVEIAKSYENKGIALSDLIQEGNIGLMISLDQIQESADINLLENAINDGIVSSIEDALSEDDLVKSANQHIVDRVNYLSEGAENLEKDLGRTASIAELAKYMEMSEKEIEDIIRVSDDEIIVKENKEKKSEKM